MPHCVERCHFTRPVAQTFQNGAWLTA